MTPVVALTGGIASGKSAAARRFESLGIRVTDADGIAHALMMPGSPVLTRVADAFGPDALTDDGRYNRAWMRERVFSDSKALARLNAIVHPAVREATWQQLEAPCRQPYQIWMIPLLVETHQEDQADAVVVVDVSPQVQMDRLLARDGVTLRSAQQTLDAQASREQRLAVADYRLDNDGTLDELHRRVDWLHQRLIQDLTA